VNTDSTARRYSPFWAVWMAFLAIILFHSMQIKALFQQRKQLRATLNEAAKSQTVNATMVNVSRDLIQMAEYFPAARQIVEDFRIQISSPSNSAGSTAKPGEPATTNKAGQPPSGSKKK